MTQNTHPEVSGFPKPPADKSTPRPWTDPLRIVPNISGGHILYDDADKFVCAFYGDHALQCAQAMVAAVNALPALEKAREALEKIAALEPAPFSYPADWDDQIKACPECQRYKDHPIQRGICNDHRQPIWRAEKHNEFEAKAIGYRAIATAREALSLLSQSQGKRDKPDSTGKLTDDRSALLLREGE